MIRSHTCQHCEISKKLTLNSTLYAKNAPLFLLSNMMCSLKYLPEGCPYMLMYSALHIMQWFSHILDVFTQKIRRKFFDLNIGKSILQVPDTGTRVLVNTRLFLRSSIVSFWITPARSNERKYHIFSRYWYTRNVPIFTNTGTFQYLGPEVYFFQTFLWIQTNVDYTRLEVIARTT